MKTLYLTIISLLFCPPTYSEWVNHSKNLMPRDNTMLAVGSYNGKIYLLGGHDNNQNHRQQTIYDIEQDLFVFYRSGYISNKSKIFGEAQFWTQIESNLYILDDLETQNILSVFDMENNIYISEWDTIPETMSYEHGHACLTAFNYSIFINGGVIGEGTTQTTRKTTHVLNIKYMTWGLASEMQTARRSHSCIVHPNNETALYSIGGSSTHSLTETIEKIFIKTIHDVEWTYLSTNLSNPMKGCRSLIYENFIIIIGGVDQSRKWYDTIHIIDTTTDLVTVSEMTLAFGTAYSAVIIVNNIMYSFGGQYAGEGMDDWQTHVLNTTRVPTSTNATPSNTTTNVTEAGQGEAPEKEGGSATVAYAAAGIVFALALLVCFVICFHASFMEKQRKPKESEGVYDKERDETDNNNAHWAPDVDDELNGNNGHNERPSGKTHDADDNEEKVDTALITNDW